MARLNKSAARVVDILSLIARSEKPLKITEISNMLDIPKSSTFSLLYTLVDKSFLEIDDNNLKTFKLGLKLFEVGTSYLTKKELPKVATPLLEKLMNEVSDTVFLAVEDEGELVYLKKFEPSSEIRTTARLGSRKPMYCTGLGKALLATYSRQKVKEIVGNGDLEALTKYTITDPKELMKDLEEIRNRGYSIDNRESEEQLFCVAAPIYDQTESSIAAISIASLASTMNQQRIEQNSKKITNVALEISRRLGFGKEKLFFNK